MAMGGGWQIRKGEEFIDEITREEMSQRTDWSSLLEAEELELTRIHYPGR